jgi:hypothetical protein
MRRKEMRTRVKEDFFILPLGRWLIAKIWFA